MNSTPTHEDELAACERRLAIAPADAAAHLRAGMANYALGRWGRGVAHLRVAVAAEPGFAAAWSNLAFGLRSTGRIAEARAAAERALALDPRLAEAWNLLGLVVHDGGQPAEAKGHFARALELNPSFAQARMNFANADQALGRIDAAAEGYEKALALDSRLPEIHYNLAHLHHKATGRMDAAIERYREAIDLRPDYAAAHHNLAHALFLVGRFEEAWREYRWRPPRLTYVAHTTRAGRPYALPAVETVSGTHLVVVGEQGLGDVLFFLRFAKLLRERGARLDFAGEPRLHPLLARTGIFDRLARSPQEIRVDDAREVLAGDLALLAGPDEIPPPIALVPDPARLESISKRLAALGPAPYVAISWRAGDPKVGLDESLLKEIPIEALGAALRGARATWISIQREPGAGEREALARHLGAEVHDLSAANHDLEEALALMAALDDYVGVSSTNVHLRAGAGAPAHVLVPFPCEWRWMARCASPWFPAMRVYRQEPAGSWNDALRLLTGDLKAIC